MQYDVQRPCLKPMVYDDCWTNIIIYLFGNRIIACQCYYFQTLLEITINLNKHIPSKYQIMAISTDE